MSGLRRTHDQNTSGHRTRPEHTTGKGRTQAKRENKILLLVGDLHAKTKKIKKKFGNMEKVTTFAEETTKSKQYENTNIKNLQE